MLDKRINDVNNMIDEAQLAVKEIRMKTQEGDGILELAHVTNLTHHISNLLDQVKRDVKLIVDVYEEIIIRLQ